MKSPFAVISSSFPVFLFLILTAFSSSISTACFFPEFKTVSVGPKKTICSPFSTRTTPVAESRIFTYSKTLRLMDCSLSPSTSSSKGVGKTICSPRRTRIFPVFLSTSRTYSVDFKEIAVWIPFSTFQVGSQNTMHSPFIVHFRPSAVSSTLQYWFASIEKAFVCGPNSSNGPGIMIFGPFSRRRFPVTLSSTWQYSTGDRE
mmetsp:Transcript_105678/g.187928  ORF Transcript_105678/g.187928 Transcript_105678/m.187928 type:complete len:202 (+) Transcript_105678:1179-1784(+)